MPPATAHYRLGQQHESCTGTKSTQEVSHDHHHQTHRPRPAQSQPEQQPVTAVIIIVRLLVRALRNHNQNSER
jgi:hypothetical protein